jgi:16S rRNA (cytosine1402-N4)-methyltransferase
VSLPARFDTPYHAPVLLQEVVEALVDGRDPRTLRFLDGTLGGGGHSAALLELGVDVTGLDRDAEAIAEAGKRLDAFVRSGKFRTFNANFAEPPIVPHAYDGILLDLGVSSHQFDDPRRGFSFREGAPLDMRMSGTATGAPPARGGTVAENDPTAADWLNATNEFELIRSFKEYADEPKAGRLAREIVRRRENRPFAISDDLVGAIRAVLGPRSGPPDFARLFQAVRIAVNDEIAGLARALPSLRDRLAPLGVIAVITYHSGEDRLVKHTFREWSVACTCPPKQLRCSCGGDNALGVVVTRRAIVAAADEILRNARARSAKLRAWRRRAKGHPAGA